MLGSPVLSASRRRLAQIVFLTGAFAALALPGQALAGADNFASAPVRSGTTVTDTGNNATATTEANEPKGMVPNGPNKTHWLVWQAGQTSSATITTCGSGFDTMLAVWTGRSLTSLQHVASNDDSACAGGFLNTLSSVTFNAVGGQRYRIQVDGFSGASGNYQINITQSGTPGQPPNNNLGFSTPLSGSSAATESGNVGATKEPGENNHFNANSTTSVWYSWTAPSAGTVVIDTCGSGHDTVLGVYTGNAFPLTKVVDGDDTPAGVCPSTGNSRVTFTTTAGRTHRIAVAGFNGNSGYFQLNLSLDPDDGAPPGTTLGAGGPSGPSASPNPSFSFTATEPGSTFECKLDGPGAATGAFEACGSPKAYSSLADGTYTFSVRAVDGAGNIDASPETRSFSVDTTGPQTTIDPDPSGTIASGDPSFSFSAEAGATFECKLDGPGMTTGSYASCTSPKAYSSLADGSYTFSVRATDTLGNTAAPATRSFTVDTVAPDTTIDSGPFGTIASGNASFSFSSEAGATFECKLDGPGAATGAYDACSPPKVYSSLADGSYLFSVRATDSPGNADVSPATRSFTVATPPPASGGGSGGGTGAQGADTTPPVASVSVPKQKLGAVLKSGKLTEDVTTNEAASLSGQAVLDAKIAKKLKLPANGPVFTSAKAKPAVVATGSAKAPAAGKVKVTLKLTAKARKKLAKLRKVTLTLRTRVTDSAGNRSLVTKRVTLKR